MGVVVGFNYALWQQQFPAMTSILEPQATVFFNMATTIHRNDGGGPVPDATTQTNLLNMATAHIAALFSPTLNGQPNSDGTNPASPLVGRIATATEGSVTVNTENNYPPGSSQWWQQTPYGSMYWLASSPFRTFRYMLNPNYRVFTPGPWGYWNFAPPY